MDNCSIHNITLTLAAVFAQKQTTLSYLPACAIDRYQPAIFFFILNQGCMGEAVRDKKFKLIQQSAWQNNPSGDG